MLIMDLSKIGTLVLSLISLSLSPCPAIIIIMAVKVEFNPYKGKINLRIKQ
jgi:hypothetical protein